MSKVPSLREQLWEVAARWIGPEFADHVAHPARLAEHLAVRAWMRRQPEDHDSRIIRAVLENEERNLWLPENMPGIAKRPLRLGVDVCVSITGIDQLKKAGHDVRVVAEHAEQDRNWFARAVKANVEIVIAQDTDIEILCYDHAIEFFRFEQHLNSSQVVERFLRHFGQFPVRT